MKISDALLWGRKILKKSKIISAELDADIILTFILKVGKEYLISNSEKCVKNSDFKKYQKLILKRAKNTPIAYLTGKKEFYGIDFFVNKSVLIPRPETEILIDSAILEIKKSKNKLKILDMGTGSGVIAVTLLKIIYEKIEKIYAADISSNALKMAEKNMKKNKIKNKIKFIKSDLFKNIPQIKFDIIYANLPYLTNDELKNPDLNFEPKIALFGGKDGVEIYQKMFNGIENYIKPNSLIFIEIGCNQTKNITKIIKKSLPNKKIQVISDLANFNRVLKIY